MSGAEERRVEKNGDQDQIKLIINYNVSKNNVFILEMDIII